MTERSYLFVPADRPERYAKGLASGAHAVIIDLEDAVAPANKDAARDTLARWLSGPSASLPANMSAQTPDHRSNAASAGLAGLAGSAGSAGSATSTGSMNHVIVRVNGSDSQWFAADRALVAASPRVSAVLLPKADGESPLDAFGEKPVLALIETAAGIDALRAITRSKQVTRLVFGSIDLQLDLGITGEGEELLLFRSQLVLASRLANLPPPVDGVSTALDDPAALAADITRARRLGFGAKLCIHPAQVAAVNAGMRPSDAELDWARRVLAAAGQAAGAAIAVDGKMVDRPVLERARALLRAAGERPFNSGG